MTTIYLINRLSTVVLGDKTPYETLFHKAVDYNAMRRIGYLAFASNPQHSTDKFNARVVPCVFVGYPFSQKGYKLLNLINNQIINS